MQRYLFDYRIALHSTIGFSPATVMFGRQLKTRFDLVRSPTIEQTIIDKQNSQIQNYKCSRNTKFETKLILKTQVIKILFGCQLQLKKLLVTDHIYVKPKRVKSHIDTLTK